MPKGVTAADEAWIQVRVPKHVKTKLEARVGRDGPSLSWVARKVLIEALEERARRHEAASG